MTMLLRSRLLVAVLTCCCVCSAQQVMIEDFDGAGAGAFDPVFDHSFAQPGGPGSGSWSFNFREGDYELALYPAIDTITFNLAPGQVVEAVRVGYIDACGPGCSSMEVIGTLGTVLIDNPECGPGVFTSEGFDIGDIQSVNLRSFEGFFDDLMIEVSDGSGCDADLDGDGVAGITDLLEYLGAYFAFDLDADFTGDGVVGIDDVLAFLSAWFAGC